MIKPFVIGVAGGSASGKTQFLQKLINNFTTEQVCMISQDHYYLPRDLQPLDVNGIENFDSPASLDIAQFSSDVISLINGKAVDKLEYTFNLPDKVASLLRFTPTPVIVIEGIFVLSIKEIVDLMDLKLFVDVKEHLKLSRRILRDKDERGCTLEDILYRYQHHVYPSYEKYIEPSKSEADIIIPNDRSFDKALEVIGCYIRNKM